MKINYDILAAIAPSIIFAAAMLVILIWGACAIRRDMKKLQQRRDEEIKRAEAMRLVPSRSWNSPKPTYLVAIARLSINPPPPKKKKRKREA